MGKGMKALVVVASIMTIASSAVVIGGAIAAKRAASV